MKIAIWHNLPSGGAKRALFHHVQGLVDRGHTVESWRLDEADPDFLPLSAIVQEHVVPLAYRPSRGRHGSFRQARHAQSELVRRLDALHESARVSAEQINRKRFDVVLVNTSRFLHVSHVGRYLEGPRVLYLQEPTRILYEYGPHFPWASLPAPARTWLSPGYLKWYLEDWLIVQGRRIHLREELENIRHYDRVLVNSRFSRESLLRATGAESRVCYLGVDAALFRELCLPRRREVLSVGAVHGFKGVDRAIRAIGAIESKLRPPLRWIANGSEPKAESTYRALAAELGVDFDLEIGVSDERLVEAYNQASVLLYTPRLEPFGFAPLEANACGLPVVALAEGGCRETVVDDRTGVLVDHDDPAVLGEAVLALLDDPTRSRLMGEKGRAEVLKRWSWSSAVDALEAQLAKTIQPTRGSSSCPR